MKRYFRLAKAIERDPRITFEQRQFSYAGFIPERRSGKDRRLAVSLVRSSSPFAVVPDRD